MSSLISSNISEKYADINRKVDAGELSLQEAAMYVAALREESKLPEEIKKDDVNYILNLLSEDDISKQIEDNAIKEHKMQKIISENSLKEKLLKQKEIELKEKDDELKKLKERELKRKKKNKIIASILLFLISLAFVYFYFRYFNKIVLAFLQKFYKMNGDGIGFSIGMMGFLGINFKSIIIFIKKICNKIKERNNGNEGV